MTTKKTQAQMFLFFYMKITLSGDELSILANTYPHKPLRKWPSAVTRLTAHLTCGLMSDLEICKHGNEYGHTLH